MMSDEQPEPTMPLMVVTDEVSHLSRGWLKLFAFINWNIHDRESKERSKNRGTL